MKTALLPLVALVALPAFGGEYFTRHVLATSNNLGSRTNVSIGEGQYYVVKLTMNSANSKTLPYILVTYPEVDEPLRVSSPVGVSITGPARIDFVGSDSVSGRGVTAFECVFGYNNNIPPLSQIVVERSPDLKRWEPATTILDTSTNVFYRLATPSAPR